MEPLKRQRSATSDKRLTIRCSLFAASFLFAIRYSLFAASFLFAIRCSLFAASFLFAIRCSLFAAFAAQEPPAADLLGLARADHLLRQKEFEAALAEMGHLSKPAQEDPYFRDQASRAFAGLYRSSRRESFLAALPPFGGKAIQTVRVTRRRQDSDRNSDQTSDNRGLQVNEHFESTLGRKDWWNGRLVLDVDGFKNGHNDVRYRTVLVDLFKGSTHLALGDSATYASPYFLRGARLRGVQLLLPGETHELQLVAGGYPFWLEDRDAYIYPRTVWGLRDKWHLMADRLRLGASLFQARDSEKIRTIDVANRPRDNVVYSLEQEMKLIPDVWSLQAYEAYSVTDDDLLTERFGNARKLKDTALRVDSYLIQPLFRWRSRYERTGPEFRILTDIPSGSVVNPKGITADREYIQQYLDFSPLGPLDLDLEASWYRNDLDDDSTVEQTRQRWATVQAGFLVPEGWPRPGLRATATETISVPGSTTRPSKTRNLDLRGELSHRVGPWSLTGFGTFEAEHPLKDKISFDEETLWSAGGRFSRPLGQRLFWSGRYLYRFFDEVFDEQRLRDHGHETNQNLSIRLWSAASLGLAYSYQRGMLRGALSAKKVDASRHLGSASFSWPYIWTRWDKSRKLTLHPTLSYTLSDATNDLGERSLFSSGLRASYEAYPDWKLQLGGEFRWDDDDEANQVHTEESRLWLLLTTHWR